jgi:hypothetical protein
MRYNVTRRGLLTTAGGLAIASMVPRVVAADSEPMFDDSKPTEGIVIPEAKVMEMNDAPLIKKVVNRVFNDSPTIKEPNGLQFTPSGTLLILDQVDPNKVFEVEPATGRILRSVQTEAIHGSGVTIGDGGFWWITSTKAPVGERTPMTLKVDPRTGKTLKKWVTPGWGYYGVVSADKGAPSGGHGVRWAGNGRYWMAVPASGRFFLMEGETGRVVRSIPAPVLRTHGVAIDGNYLWVVASDFWSILKLDSKDGKILAKIQLDKKNDPSLHCLEMRNGVLWYCDASKGWVCNLT